MLDWLAKLLDLPPAFLARTADGRPAPGGGVIQGTASEAMTVAILAARTRALQGRPAEDACRLVVYTSDQVWPGDLVRFRVYGRTLPSS